MTKKTMSTPRSIRMTDEEYEAVMKYAEERGWTFPVLVKQAIDHLMNTPPETPKPRPSPFGMTGSREFRPISKEKQAGRKK